MKSPFSRLLLTLATVTVLSSCTMNLVPSTPSSSSSVSTDSVSTVSSSESSATESESSLTSEPSISSTSSSSSAEGDYIPLPERDSRWPLSFKEYGMTFRTRLSKLINMSGDRTTSYNSIGNVLDHSDAAPTGSGIVPFYHDSSYHISHYNREHVWPNSRGAGTTGPGADPQMIRPTDENDNNQRSNYFYGDAMLDTAGNTWDPASLGYEAARGEAARIIFYTATRYYNTCGTGGTSRGTTALSLSNNPADATDAHTMGRLDRLIEWNRRYPVTAMERQRNNYLDNAGFARNPFIDHPEYADWIWDKEGLRNAPVNTDPIGEEDVPSLDYAYNYRRITSSSAITNKVGIAGKMSKDTTYYAMGNGPKNSAYPYYIASEDMIYHDDIFSIDTHDIRYFNIEQLNNGNYTIRAGSNYLYNYIEGTYYSVAYNSDKPGASNEWTITFGSNGTVVIRGATNAVYLEYWENAKGSKDFTGYNRAPSEPLVLIQ